MTDPTKYILGQSAAAARRLAIQDRQFAGPSERLLDLLGLRPADRVVELGCGPGGLTRRVELELDGGAVRRVLLADGAGRWRWEGGPELAGVAGALDVDLTVTPATNTLPIRRLGLEVGQAVELSMAWVQFPGLEVVGSAQRYQRLAPDRWRFSTGDFTAELLVDPDGLVLDYGGLFRSLAYRPG